MERLYVLVEILIYFQNHLGCNLTLKEYCYNLGIILDENFDQYVSKSMEYFLKRERIATELAKQSVPNLSSMIKQQYAHKADMSLTNSIANLKWNQGYQCDSTKPLSQLRESPHQKVIWEKMKQ